MLHCAKVHYACTLCSVIVLRREVDVVMELRPFGLAKKYRRWSGAKADVIFSLDTYIYTVDRCDIFRFLVFEIILISLGHFRFFLTTAYYSINPYERNHREHLVYCCLQNEWMY